jgi:predicted dehydrogenase
MPGSYSESRPGEANVEPYGIAVIGLDHWYNGFPMLDAIYSNPQAQLRWVADPDPDKTKFVAEKYGALHSSPDYEKALNDPEVQIVACFCSVNRSAELCVAAAEAGKHIISIKPMAMNLEEADRVVKTVRRSGVKYFPGSASQVFFASHKVYKEWIDQDRIGQVRFAFGTFYAGLPASWPNSPQPGWFVDPKRVPGGAWIDHATFYIQSFRHILHSNIVRVEGVTANLKYPELGVEDFGQSIFTLADGTVVTICATWLAAGEADRQSLEFYGSAGSIVWDTLSGKVAVSGKLRGEEQGWMKLERPVDEKSRAYQIIDHLIDCILEDRDPICTVEDDRAGLAAALAFYEAARTHTAVEITA